MAHRQGRDLCVAVAKNVSGATMSASFCVGIIFATRAQ
jgi:hypothetical protein